MINKLKEHFFQGNSLLIESCRKNGFVTLDWVSSEIDPVTGNRQKTDEAKLKDENYTLILTISHPDLEKKSNDNKFRILITFSYFTLLGPISSYSEHLEYSFEKAIEFATWQATLISRMFKSLDQNQFSTEIVNLKNQ